MVKKRKSGMAGWIMANKLSSLGLGFMVIGGMLCMASFMGVIGKSVDPILLGLLLLGIGFMLFQALSKYVFKIPKVGASGYDKYIIGDYKMAREMPDDQEKHFKSKEFLKALINGESKRHDNGEPIEGEYVFVGLRQAFSLREKEESMQNNVAPNNILSQGEKNAMREPDLLLNNIHAIVNDPTKSDKEKINELKELFKKKIGQYLENKIKDINSKNKSSSNNVELLPKQNNSEIAAEMMAKSLFNYIKRKPPVVINHPDTGIEVKWVMFDKFDLGLVDLTNPDKDNPNYLLDYMKKDAKHLDAGHANSFVKFGLIGAALGGIVSTAMYCTDFMKKSTLLVNVPSPVILCLSILIGAAIMVGMALLYSRNKDMEVPKSITDFEDAKPRDGLSFTQRLGNMIPGFKGGSGFVSHR